MAKQSLDDQEQRLTKGCCPIHGGGMGQADRHYRILGGRTFTIVECMRRDCDIQAVAWSIDGPWDLLPTTDERVLIPTMPMPHGDPV